MQVIRYDGQGRRIQKRIQNSADRDATEHHYYDGQRLVELRNGSDLVLKQQIWGLDYIDELVEVAINRDPADATEQVCDRPFYAVHNAQYNVMGLLQPVYSNVTAQQAGGQRLVERYEYTPYGERRVYGHYDGGLNGDFNGDGQVGQEDLDVVLLNFGSTSPYLDVDGNGIVSQGEFDAVLLNFGDSIVQNDPLALAPRAGTYRGLHSQGGGLGVALNEVGHQGLVHDEEARLVYNRARYLHPGLGRFVQRDSLGYVDGSNLYAYVRNQPLKYGDYDGNRSRRFRTRSSRGAGRAFGPDRADDRRERFERWYERELSELNEWIGNIPRCPAKIDFDCKKNPIDCDNGRWEGLTDGGRFHPGEYCMRSTGAGFGPGQQCCYDKESGLLTGGSADRENASLLNFGFSAHFFADVAPVLEAIYLDRRFPGQQPSYVDRYLSLIHI